MRRRSLLAGLAGLGAIAGCNSRRGVLTPSDSSGVSSPTTDPPSGTEPTSDGQSPTETDDRTETTADEWEVGSADVIDLEIADRTYALAPPQYRSADGGAVRMRFTQPATTKSPTLVEATLTNENPFPNTFRLEWTPPFGRLASDSPRPLGERYGDGAYDAGLVFVPTTNHDLVSDPPSVARASDGYWRLPNGVYPELPERVRLDPGESVYGEYALVGRAEGVGTGRPPGVYEFSRGGERPLRVTVWQTSVPGPDRDSRFAGLSVPSVSDDRTVAWYHDATATTAVFVRPSVERTTLPAGITFTAINRSRNETRCGHWNLYKRRGSRWFHLGPYIHTADCRGLVPGEATSWQVRVDNNQMAPCDGVAFPFLGGGQYAAVAGYGGPTGSSGAIVELDAPPVTIVPTDDATSDRTNGRVVVTTDRWRQAPDHEGQSRVRIDLTRVSGGGRRIIAEQVMRRRFRGLRNTLAFTGDSVERVRLRTDDTIAGHVIGYESSSRRYRYDGTSYELERVE